jgi:type IV pilus assembly protein PilA
MKIYDKKKGFTLIELLVVVAIMGFLAAIGIVAYNGYTLAAKRNATLAQHSKAIKFINNTLALCDVNNESNLKISNKRTIDCNASPNASDINKLNDIFINHFLDLGWKNPYGGTKNVVYAGRNGSQDTDGRMRFDETVCSSGSSSKQIALWVKTHKEYYPILIKKDGWCN